MAGKSSQNSHDHPRPHPGAHENGYENHTCCVRGVPITHKTEVQFHVHHHLGIEGRLVAYERVGPTWQLNVVNMHVSLGDTTDTFLEHILEAYRQLGMMGPAVIIGDFNAAPTVENRGGRLRWRTQL